MNNADGKMGKGMGVAMGMDQKRRIYLREVKVKYLFSMIQKTTTDLL